MTHECRHIMPNGAKCHAAALRGKPYCYFHTRLHHFTSQPPIPPDGTLRLPVLEDQTAIQLAVSQVLDALCSSRLDPRRAGLFLYGIQIASQNVERKFDIIPRTTVESITQTDAGEDLAPEERICNAPEDCVDCPDRDTCEDYDPPRKKRQPAHRRALVPSP